MEVIKIRGGIPVPRRQKIIRYLPFRITPHLRYIVDKVKSPIGLPHIGSSTSGMLRHVESFPTYSENFGEGQSFRLRRIGYQSS